MLVVSGSRKGVITNVGPRNADGKDSITRDSGNMASSNTSGSWYAESRNRKKNTCPANIN